VIVEGMVLNSTIYGRWYSEQTKQIPNFNVPDSNSFKNLNMLRPPRFANLGGLARRIL